MRRLRKASQGVRWASSPHRSFIAALGVSRTSYESASPAIDNSQRVPTARAEVIEKTRRLECGGYNAMLGKVLLDQATEFGQLDDADGLALHPLSCLSGYMACRDHNTPGSLGMLHRPKQVSEYWFPDRSLHTFTLEDGQHAVFPQIAIDSTVTAI
jgi:hypothetical protein